MTNFMSDIADEFKIVVVEAIRSLCLKFPLKYRSLMNFLSNILREEGGFEYKKAIVDSIIILIRDIPDAKESGLFHLCEFIEDCEFTYLSTQPRIFVLLRRCLFDGDDEVRDRATLYLKLLGGEATVGETEKDVNEFLFGSLDVPLVNLETSLRNYEPSDVPFDISSVSKETKSQPLAEKSLQERNQLVQHLLSVGPVSTVDASYEKLLSSIPEFADFGKLFKVVVFVDASEAEEFLEVASKPLESLPYDSPGQTFVLLKSQKVLWVDSFVVFQVDPSTGEAEDDGVEDEYQLEDLEIVSADYMLKVGVSNFRNAWESMDPESERVDEYGLGVRENLTEAVSAVISILGMQPCEGTEAVPSNSRSHTCLLSGVFIGNVKVLVRLSFGITASKEVAMKLAVRSDDPEISDKIHEIVANG
ncbi:hypothetical protein HU200_007530 [Digitaria exilis]|uniref:Coatomer subunit gamma n=1 Tax=Digitaria exilis TaxID=1010633 RepID=A0A835FP38_9POAL|nr:hypothetical protein HU200_007530 [Digitaria exilis]